MVFLRETSAPILAHARFLRGAQRKRYASCTIPMKPTRVRDLTPGPWPAATRARSTLASATRTGRAVLPVFEPRPGTSSHPVASMFTPFFSLPSACDSTPAASSGGSMAVAAKKLRAPRSANRRDHHLEARLGRHHVESKRITPSSPKATPASGECRARRHGGRSARPGRRCSAPTMLAGGRLHDHWAASMMRAVSAASSICGQCPASSA